MEETAVTRETLLRRYERTLDEYKTAGEALTKARSALAINCLHEKALETKEANDNGYGKWWYTHYDVCVFCQHREYTGRSDYK